MKFSASSNNYDIIYSGNFILFSEDSDLTIYFDSENGFNFQLKLLFESDETEKQIINRVINDNNNIVFVCKNFLSSGTGTFEPIEIATIDGKKIYVSLWSYLEGNYIGLKKTRKVEIIFFKER